MTTKVKDVKEKSKLTKEEWREFTKTMWAIANTSHPDHPAVFPVEIPHRLIKLFSFWGETVLDPFGGMGTTAEAAVPLGRRVICVDQNKDYVVQTRKKIDSSFNGEAGLLEAILGDARDLGTIEDSSVGLIVTSPPYWNKADYGNGSRNLGTIESYAEFLGAIKPAFKECFRVLQPGRKFCIVTAHVNQHTDHGLLTFPLATDFTNILREIGFVLVNEIIWSKDKTGGKWGSYGQQRPIFGSYPYPPNFHFKNIHEYILIAAKPSTSPTKGPKVLNYSELMGPLIVKGQDNGHPAKNRRTQRRRMT